MGNSKELDIRLLGGVDDLGWLGFLSVLNNYAKDPIGRGESLSEERLSELRSILPSIAHGYYFLATKAGEAVGILSAFRGFSTFQAKPLLNIHDLAVMPRWHGHGVGTALLEAAEALGRSEGCCRLSLEVRTDNPRAQRLYERIGFVTGGDGYEIRFMEKHF